MEKPNWKELNRFFELLTELDSVVEGIFSDELRQASEIKSAYDASLKANTILSLSSVPVDELKKSKAGIRTAALKEAGFANLADLANATDAQIASADGVGEKQISSIRNIIAEFMNGIIGYTRVRISPDDDSELNLNLLCSITRYRKGQQIRAAVMPHAGDLHIFAQDINARLLIRNGFRWVFSGRKTKESTVAAFEEMKNFFRSEQYAEIERLTKMYRRVSETGPVDAKSDFTHNAAEFYAILERVSGMKIRKSLVYSSIPEQIAATIDEMQLDLRCFKGNLRAYQEFGTKYILHQGRVLLGDEMGLGKTVQATAAMSHIYANAPSCHFLVVCPAGLLVNWCREIAKFSTLPVQMLHGPVLEDGFVKWQQEGGVAVTNYESMGKIIDRIDEIMQLEMLVIDEAHYIKNPEAKRTAYIHRLQNESARILLMTGTPVENRVDEMCALIDFIRPDLADEVRKKAYMSAVPEFREMLAPVYLRRQRDMVLDELPPIEEQQEWCSMNAADLAAYTASVAEKNFTAMRRVGFHLEDASLSCKGERLAELCAEARATGRKVIIYSFFRETIRKVYELLADDCAGVITGSTDTIERQNIIDRFSESEQGRNTGASDVRVPSTSGESGQSLFGQPVSGYTVSGQSVSGQSVSEQSLSGQPVSGYTVSGQSVSEQSVVGQPVFGQSVSEQSAVGQGLTVHEVAGQEKVDEGHVLICQIQAGGTGLNIQAASIVIFCEPQIKPSLTNQAISRVYRMGQVRNVLVYHLLCENTVDEAVMQILEEKQREFDLYADESTMAEATEGLFDRDWIRQYIEEENRKYLPAVVSAPD